MNKSSRLTRAEQKMWLASTKAQTIYCPPYSSGMAVTPDAVYADDEWSFPRENATFGRRHSSSIKHRTHSFLSTGTVPPLDHIQDAVLLDQLKQAGVAYLFRREALPNRRKRLANISTVRDEVAAVKRFLAAVRALGRRCLSEVTPQDLPGIEGLLRKSKSDRKTHIETFTDLVWLSRAGLIIPPLTDYEWTFSDGDTYATEGNDATRARGRQPFSEQEAAELIRTCLFYMDRAELLCNLIYHLGENPQSADDTRIRLSKTMPFFEEIEPHLVRHTLILLIMISAANLICFHLGLRPSELLSMQRNFIRVTSACSEQSEKVKVGFYRSKGMPYPKLREVTTDGYLSKVGAALEAVREAMGSHSQFLFTTETGTEEMSVSTFNGRLSRFSQLNGLSGTPTGYNWRKTLVDFVVRTITDGITILNQIMDHATRTETSDYALSSPHLAQDIHAEVLAVYTRRAGTLFEVALSSEKLGGAAGKRIEAALSQHVTSEDLGLTEEEFAEDMLAQNIFPVRVAPGKFCVKPPTVRGQCSTSSNDLMADSANCSDGCFHMAQLPEQRQILEENLAKIATYLRSSASRMQKSYAASRVSEQLAAWPELKPELDKLVKANRDIKKWFSL